MDLMSPLADSVSAEQSETARGADWSFVLADREARVFTDGLSRRLTPGGAETLGARVRAFFDDLRGGRHERIVGGPALLVGALPFDRTADDFLFQPARVVDAPTAPAYPPPPGGCWRVTPEPTVEGYQAAVAKALSVLASAADDLTKVVLARSLRLRSDAPIDVAALAARLAGDPGAVRFGTPIGQGRRLVGASPELLIAKKGASVRSHPLAGSARRSADAAADQTAADSLDHSDKDHREHALVVEAILDILAPHCRELNAPSQPELTATQTMWHLGTHIEGKLKRPDEVSAAELAAALHPTPAVAGSPRDAATDLIHRLEGYERGFYAGAVGWTDMAGDGVWYVSLRCAEVAGAEARLYAGAGVVEGSTPEGEAAETSAKFQAMLRAFGIDEAGRPLDQGA